MNYIVYVSTAKRLMNEEELLNLLKISRKNNKNNNITGMLLYCQGTFMQVIEGNDINIERVFKIIELDPRHKNIIKLASGKSEKRNFPDWSMAFASVNPETLQEIEGFLSCHDEKQIINSAHITVSMLKTFAENNRLQISF